MTGIRISLRKLARRLADSGKSQSECDRVFGQVFDGDFSELTKDDIEACKVDEEATP